MRNVYITVILIFSCFYGFSQSEGFDIGFLLDKTNVELDAMLDELEVEIQAVVGEDAEIRFSKDNRLINNFDPSLALEQYHKFLSSDVDIIIAFGSINNTVLTSLDGYEKPTILFGNINKELIKKPPFNSSEKVENFTVIATVQNYEEDLKALNEITSAKRIGIMIERSFLNASDFESAFNKFQNNLDFETEIVSFESLDDLISKVDGYDAIYLLGSFYLTSDEVSTLAEVLIDKKIGSFTTTPLYNVKNGLLATNHNESEIDQFFRRIALNVEGIGSAPCSSTRHPSGP